jgi:hypothetical protein
MIQGVSGFRRRQCAKGKKAPMHQRNTALRLAFCIETNQRVLRSPADRANERLVPRVEPGAGRDRSRHPARHRPRSRSRTVRTMDLLHRVGVHAHRGVRSTECRGGARDGRHKTRGRRPVPVDDVEGPITLQRTHKRGVLRRQPTRTSEVVYHRAEQGMAAGTIVVAKCVHRQIVPSCLTLDEPQQRRNDPLASASIDAARHDERKARERPSSPGFEPPRGHGPGL